MQLTSTQKKVIYSAGLIIAAGFFAFIIYILFFKAPEEEYVNINGELVPVSIFPEISLNLNLEPELENVNAFVGAPAIDKVAKGGATEAEIVLPDEATSTILAENGKDLQYYDAETGQFYRVKEDGELELLTDEIFKGVENVNWSNDSNEAVLEFEDGYNIYYDFEKGKQYTLPSEMEEFTFSPTDEQIGYKYLTDLKENRWLGIINPDGSNPYGIERLGENESQVQVNWSPSGNILATYQEYVDGSHQAIVPIGLNKENFKQMAVEGRQFEYQWSPNGEQMLYSSFSGSSDFKPSLSIVGVSGDEIGTNPTSLEINTWQDKCTFNGSSELYCAVPQSLPAGAGYDRNYANDIPDSIYKVDLNTGNKNLVAVPTDDLGSAQYTVESMYVSGDGKYLYFTDVNDKNIRKIQLK